MAVLPPRGAAAQQAPEPVQLGTADSFAVPAGQSGIRTTVTSLSSSANPSTAGKAVTFTATVTATGITPTGFVNFLDDGTLVATDDLDSSSLATYTTTTLDPGSHTVTAVYTGSQGFEKSTSPPITRVVTAAPTTTTTRRAVAALLAAGLLAMVAGATMRVRSRRRT